MQAETDAALREQQQAFELQQAKVQADAVEAQAKVAAALDEKEQLHVRAMLQQKFVEQQQKQAATDAEAAYTQCW